MKSSKVVLLWILLIVLIIISAAMFYLEETSIAFFSVLFAIFDLIILCKSLVNENPHKKYYNKINSILKTYECILVEIKELPYLSEKKLIITQSFQDIVNTEYERRKPVYYLYNDNAYDFVLIDNDEAYIHTIRKDENLKSRIDIYIENQKNEEMILKKEQEVIGSLEKTTVIKIGEEEFYRISPIRNKEV